MSFGFTSKTFRCC